MIDVLVVDDDFMVARINRGFVERIDGFRVVGTAHTGREAIEAVASLSPDLVLLDLYLPDIFGLDVVTRLRAAGHDCDFLVISATRETDSVRAAARQGAVNYLLKPFDFKDLQVRLERYAAERAELGNLVVSGQADIDRILHRGASPGAPPLPKGMSAETAELVKRALIAADAPMSAAECASVVGISRVSTRRYLEYFGAAGLARVTLKYGTGRPERLFQWIS
ncbi:response regulator [Actinomadura rudentiformis]|uniref:Transcriptional regulatory protein n=1 Tax=Actinomadura rudentiformis TaxID=359158 RepID=A0A6H9Z0Z1_9ACTN|nr:response regulator [Actinomadura rudentiformis]KAB2351435.1 response regulator [Actinomadura rudentiformis]